MRAGALRHRVIIQSPVYAADGMGGKTVSRFQDVITVWAEMDPPKAREWFGAGQVQTEVITRVRIRYRDGITTAHRIKFGDRLFDINAIVSPDERKRELIMMCVERTPQVTP